jgi:hypothetical protein
MASDGFTFCSPVNERLQTLRILRINHPDKSGIDPPSGLDTIQTTDDDLELHVVILVFVLNLADIRRDLDTLNSLFYECCSDLCLRLADVSLPEQELPVQVRDVNRIFLELNQRITGSKVVW